MNIATIEQIAHYLATYLRAYRDEYRLFVDSPPRGGGYPPIQVSPYLYTTQLLCLVGRDGYAIADFSRQPDYRWEIAGGPALVTDFPESRTPQEIIELLKAKEIWAKPIGLYRIVAQSGITDEIWRGYLGRLVSSIQVQAEGVQISVNKYDVDWLSLVQRLTFGAYGLILDVKLPKPTSPYWRPHITRDLGFAPADRNNKRFFHYLELDPHLDSAAWDERSIPTRISVDLRRDFAYSFVKRHYSKGGTNSGGGTISIGPANLWAEGFRDHLGILGDTISQFTRLLSEKPDAEESVFHEFLERNPIMLDAYGDIKSKPRFVYPPGESPVGKEYVEPDFIVCYPNNSYKLIELESPSKNLV